ncbi:MAG: ArsR family transcriptional regulator [Rhizobiales bacterium]|nr:ArsR family transcriptional regulator [Hyphomicrobiales bacterium]
MSYADLLTAKRRLTILRYLEGALGYSMNLSLMKDALLGVGIKASTRTVSDDFDWLDSKKLIEKEVLEFGVIVAKITMYGQDVAKGLEICDGVTRPSPD